MARRRGQAALEFLSTYGFAFLLILLMIAALSYFGVLSPSKYLPGRCLVSSEFRCEDRILYRTTPAGALDVNFTIVNQLGNTITFANGATMVANSTLGNAPCIAVPAQLVSGQRAIISCQIPAGSVPAKGEKAKVSYTLVYQELGGTFQRIANGEIAETIQ